MAQDIALIIQERLAILEQRQRRVWRWMSVLGVVVFLQAVLIAYLVIPFGSMAKHPITLQAGKFQAIDGNGEVRAELSAQHGQTTLKMSDARGNTRILLRENDEGFATMEYFDRANNDRTMTLYSGDNRSFLALNDPKTRHFLNVQAAAEGVGLMKYDENKRRLP